MGERREGKKEAAETMFQAQAIFSPKKREERLTHLENKKRTYEVECNVIYAVGFQTSKKIKGRRRRRRKGRGRGRRRRRRRRRGSLGSEEDFPAREPRCCLVPGSLTAK